jgi:hypothetical protein
MTIFGIDYSSNNAGFSAYVAVGQGYRAIYIKVGGNNLSGNVPYISDSFAPMAAQAQSAGMPHRGGYWLVGGHNPTAAAEMYISAVAGKGLDFHVVDNETLDSGNMWSDAEQATFLRLVHAAFPNDGLWFYGARDNNLANRDWPSCRLGQGPPVHERRQRGRSLAHGPERFHR